MANHGFIKVASAIPQVKPGNCKYNAEHTLQLAKKAAGKGARIVCFPELGITAYTCQDLFESSLLINEAENALGFVADETKSLDIITIVGLPIVVGGFLANCAAVINKGKILGIVPKTYIPNYKEFYERRWFASSEELQTGEVTLCGQTVKVSEKMIFDAGDAKFGIEICEDLWAPIPRSPHLAMAGAEIIFNLSADNECVGKFDYVKGLVKGQSASAVAGYVFTSCGYGESTQDVVFAGNSLICENGNVLAQSGRFSLKEQLTVSEIDVEAIRHDRRTNTTFRACAKLHENLGDYTFVNAAPESDKPSSKEQNALTRHINPQPFVPSAKDFDARCEDIFSIQAEGLAKRIDHIGAKTLVIGISGGLDSTLALLVCAKACDMLNRSRKTILGITMPGFGTSGETHANAVDIMKEMGISSKEISIKKACIQHFKDIGHDLNTYDTTYENIQARERTQVLMDVANQSGGIVVGTGDLSELALGWATYNGDHMSMYGVNCSIPKTLVRHLIKWVASKTSNDAEKATLERIVATPISPELVPTDENGEIVQKTEDKVGPYELHDFFLYYTLRYGFGPEKIFFLAKEAFLKDKAPRYDEETIKKWLKVFFHRFFQQQFKRSCLPDGPKVGSCSLSPRGDWRMPSDADGELWAAECERL